MKLTDSGKSKRPPSPFIRVPFYRVIPRVHVHDVNATILRLMGFDHERLTYRYAGRDFRLTDVHGHVVEKVFA
ncbi:hypothetical protein K239x_30250 [Planctomycetes bacterium K23_9]|uniref:DUF1501 domain-containing protein n=1 Tax=Stieleria marina TaxID=1930275 RepID=A0A517NV92_9BACT|nr:hypothetical protein K239x_30250 [Planctomycetes bacterium K23_9]